VRRNHFPQAIDQRQEALGQRSGRWRADDSMGEVGKPLAFGDHNAPAATLQSGVDAKEAHTRRHGDDLSGLYVDEPFLRAGARDKGVRI
jgi:hypothetical protein